MPQLAPTQDSPNNVVSFNERYSVSKPKEYWLDFFDDGILLEGFWSTPERSFNKLKQFAGLIAPSFPMLPELLPAQNILNCTRNRVMAYYLQMNNYKVIPVASWVNKEDFSWCFDGLPSHSAIAISTNGYMDDPHRQKSIILGIEELQKQKCPSNIIICGQRLLELSEYDNIYYYQKLVQTGKERRANG